MCSPLIIHTEASDGWGGQEMRIAKEMRYFASRGYRVALAAPAHSLIYKNMSAEGFECWDIKFSKAGRFGDFLRLWRLFQKERPLMVGTHSSADSWAGLPAAKLAGIPAVLRYRHISVPVKNNPFNRFIYGLPDAIVTTGDCISGGLAALRVPASRLHTISTGITSPSDLPEKPEAQALLRRELGLPPEAHFIGITAVLRSWKGQDYLMSGFDIIAERWPQLHLILVGAGPAEEFLRKHAATLPSGKRIHFLGYRKDFYPYVRAFDCDLLTSTQHEGIPQSLLDAMFMKTPVVGTNVGGIPEIVKDGVTGLLIPPKDPASIAEAVEKVLNDPAAAAARAQTAYETVMKKNTMEVMGQKIEALISSIRLSKEPHS
jgi:glycosyltransferase involved in cell wall biosynthesis